MGPGSLTQASTDRVKCDLKETGVLLSCSGTEVSAPAGSFIRVVVIESLTGWPQPDYQSLPNISIQTKITSLGLFPPMRAWRYRWAGKGTLIVTPTFRGRIDKTPIHRHHLNPSIFFMNSTIDKPGPAGRHVVPRGCRGMAQATAGSASQLPKSATPFHTLAGSMGAMTFTCLENLTRILAPTGHTLVTLSVLLS